MFSEGTRNLIDRLPALEGLAGEWARRRLSEAYLDVLAASDVIARDPRAEVTRDVRRLTDALELFALGRPPDDQHAAACAFVAAEALELRASSRELPEEELLRLEAGLLFVVAGYDANAAACCRDVSFAPGSPRSWALTHIADLLRQRAARDEPFPILLPDRARKERIADALWLRLGNAMRSQNVWLRGGGADTDGGPALSELTDMREALVSARGADSRYADIFHLVELAQRAVTSQLGRAIRPLGRHPALQTYVERTCRSRPLLWPGAQAFAREALELNKHVAISVPTGSGKSAIAELAVVRALHEGWTLYLAPTNALVSQIRRDLTEPVARGGGDIRSFVGGGEYTDEESIEGVAQADVFVMTPEKCALLLRQSPEAFTELRLMIMDECHLIGSTGSRGVVAELVAAEVMERAPRATVILMSALVDNAPELASWLASATGRESIPIEEPWRPTRTMRGVVALSGEAFERARQASLGDLAARPTRVSRHRVPLAAMVSLQGPWIRPDEPANYAIVPLPSAVEAQFRLSAPRSDVAGWRNRVAESLTRALATAGEHVLTFVPANKHEVVTVGRAVAQQMPERALQDAVDDHLSLAEYELGRASEVRTLLQRGVATHSAALVDDERTASEIAFGRNSSASIMIATTSLAQGLNLPATVVVVAGTAIGQSVPDTARAARDLLNGIGRAGRPFVANRSLALVIPSGAHVIGDGAAPSDVLAEARFLRFEDAATPLESQLVELLRRDPNRLASLDAMTEEEIAAFTFLPMNDGGATAGRILSRSLGHHQRRLEVSPTADETASALAVLGSRFLAASESPGWLVDVAYQSGVDLRAVSALYRTSVLNPRTAEDVSGWARILVDRLQEMPYGPRELLADLSKTPEPLLRGLRRNDREAWSRLSSATIAYLEGQTLAEIGLAAFNATREDGRRSSGDPLPKAIGLVRDLLSYRLSIAGGAMAVLYRAAHEQGAPELTLDDDARSALDALPLALRLGCGSRDARLWARYALRRRRLAHLFAGLRPIPPGLTAEEPLRAWMRQQLSELANDPEALIDLPEEDRHAAAAAVLRLT